MSNNKMKELQKEIIKYQDLLHELYERAPQGGDIGGTLYADDIAEIAQEHGIMELRKDYSMEKIIDKYN